MDGISANLFQGVHIDNIPAAEELPKHNILQNNIDIADENIIWELARRSVN